MRRPGKLFTIARRLLPLPISARQRHGQMRSRMKESGNVFLIGPMGAGKTTVGRVLARNLGLKFLDSDHEIAKAANASISWIFDREGEAGFRRRESRMIANLTGQRGILLATGGGSVLDIENRNLLKDRGIVVYLYLSLEAQLSRNLKDANRPLLRAPDRAQRIRALYELRHPLYSELADIRVDAKRGYPQLVSGAIARELNRYRTGSGAAD